MRAAHLTIGATPATVGDWRELASRGNDGLEISLLWSKSAELVKISVRDERVGEYFDFDIAGTDALSAFHHPFAYAADRGVCFGDAMRESNDLQLQS